MTTALIGLWVLAAVVVGSIFCGAAMADGHARAEQILDDWRRDCDRRRAEQEEADL